MITGFTFLEKFDRTSVETAFYTIFCHNYRPEVTSDVVSGVAVGKVDMDAGVKCGETTSCRSSVIRRVPFAMDQRNDETNKRH